MSPTVRVVLMVLRGEELLLAGPSRGGMGFELPSTMLVAGESFATACRRIVLSEGLPRTVEPELQRFANVRTSGGAYEVHVGFIVFAPQEFERAESDPRGRFFPLSSLPAALDSVTRGALTALSRQESVVDLEDGEPGSVENPEPFGLTAASATSSTDETPDDRVTSNAGDAPDDRVTSNADDAPEVPDDRATPSLRLPPHPPVSLSHPPPLPAKWAGEVYHPVAPFTLWFAGALLWMTAVALVIEHHQVLPSDVVLVAWGSLVVSSLLFISRAGLPRAKDEDPPPFRRWALTLGVGFVTLFGIALFMSVFASPLGAGQAYLLLGVLGMLLFFIARRRAQSYAPPVQRSSVVSAGQFVLWLGLVLVSLVLFVVV